jgi:2,3-bisphosphoglycerate-dependent phosphoglycerate mutase
VTIVLVRHAEPVQPGDPRFEENDRPLSDAGAKQAQRLAGVLGARAPAAIYSSPYPRAVQTVEPLARQSGLAIEIVDDLRERLLSPGPLPDWRSALGRSFTDFDVRAPGGESSREAQVRVLGVLDAVRERHGNRRVILASHGNLIALALHAHAPDTVDFGFWAAMPMPAVYELADGGAVSGPGFDAPDL